MGTSIRDDPLTYVAFDRQPADRSIRIVKHGDIPR